MMALPICTQAPQRSRVLKSCDVLPGMAANWVALTMFLMLSLLLLSYPQAVAELGMVYVVYVGPPGFQLEGNEHGVGAVL
jgi:hypothetical protein